MAYEKGGRQRAQLGPNTFQPPNDNQVRQNGSLGSRANESSCCTVLVGSAVVQASISITDPFPERLFPGSSSEAARPSEVCQPRPLGTGDLETSAALGQEALLWIHHQGAAETGANPADAAAGSAGAAGADEEHAQLQC